MGAPIRKALQDIGAGKSTNKAEIPYREDEKYWIVSSEAGGMTVVYAINFPNPDDTALARLMLVEFQAAMRKVKNPISAKYHDKEPPAELLVEFPNVTIQPYSSGFMTISKCPFVSD